MAKKFICNVCGQTFEADAMPDKCPICGASASNIKEVAEEGAEAPAGKGKKKLDKNSNTYTILYASIMVIIVAFLLAGVSILLKQKQDANVEIDRQSQVLASLRMRGMDKSDVTPAYEKIVEEGTLPGSDLPLFTCHLDSTNVKYVVPVKGRGRWGGLWGYVAVNADGQSVYGAYFSHESETAGLGALIAETKFVLQLGYAGKAAIHPSQCKLINDAYAPDEKSLKKAIAVVIAAREAEAKGIGVISVNGKMVDRPVVLRAQRTMELAIASGIMTREEAYE